MTPGIGIAGYVVFHLFAAFCAYKAGYNWDVRRSDGKTYLAFCAVSEGGAVTVFLSSML